MTDISQYVNFDVGKQMFTSFICPLVMTCNVTWGGFRMGACDSVSKTRAMFRLPHFFIGP